VAAALLALYLLQCLWLLRVQALRDSEPDSDQALRIHIGLQQWKGGAIAGTPESLRSEAATGVPSSGRLGHLRVRDGFDEDRSPLYYLTAAAPFVVRPASWTSGLPLWQVLAAAPYLFFGVMLGGSLWYVARRLYGNAGGYVALLLYCFSPAMISGVSAQSLGEIGRGVGRVWSGMDRDRRRPHLVCSARSRAVELRRFCCWDCLWRLQWEISSLWPHWRCGHWGSCCGLHRFAGARCWLFGGRRVVSR